MHKTLKLKKVKLKDILKLVEDGYSVRLDSEVEYLNSKNYKSKIWQLDKAHGKVLFKTFRGDAVNKKLILKVDESEGNGYNLETFIGLAGDHIKITKKNIEKCFGFEMPSDILDYYKERRDRKLKNEKKINKSINSKTTYTLVYFKTRSRNDVRDHKGGENRIRVYLNQHIRDKYEGFSARDEFTTAGLKSRADTVIFSNKEIHVFEIKSEKDSFARLQQQVDDYKKYADKITLVLHVDKLSAFMKNHSHFLEDIGLLVYENGELKQNSKSKKLKPTKSRIDLLWRAELKNITKGVKGISKYTNISDLTSLISKSFSAKEVEKMSKNILFNRFDTDKSTGVLDPGSLNDGIIEDRVENIEKIIQKS